MKLKIVPNYGWGWTDSSGATADVPPPFQLEVTILREGEPFRTAMGYHATEMQHPLANCWIVLLQRHNASDGITTCLVTKKSRSSLEAIFVHRCSLG